MRHEIRISGLSGINDAARQFLAETAGCGIVAFYAPMGAGKTTFIAALCRVLGVREDSVGSPTFAIVNEYRTDGGEAICHFDFYRIGHFSEALDIGFYDYVDSGARCFIEWPENIGEILPGETLKVVISVDADGARTLSWEDAI